MRKVYQIVGAASLFWAVFLSEPALSAVEQTNPQDTKVSPWGEIKLHYDDNVYLSSSNKKDDFIVTLTPGVSLYLPFSDNLFKFDYSVDINKYMDNTSQDANNHYASGNLELNWRDVSFNIYDKFGHVFERPSTEDTSRVKRDDNRAGIAAKVQKEKLGVQLGYENFMRDYKSDATYDVYDRAEHLYSFIVTHKTFPKSELLLEYDFSQIRYDKSVHSDSDYHQVLIGIIGGLTPKTEATIKAGYQTREYERADEPNFNTGVLYADLTHKFSDKNAIKLSLSRTANESTYGTNNFYKVESITAILDHFFTPKLLGFLTGEFQINSYPRETTEGSETKKREDNYYLTGAGLRYYLQKWLTFTLKFEHIVRNSNFDTFEYDQNLITFTAKAVF
jgi:hypothetical protein